MERGSSAFWPLLLPFTAVLTGCELLYDVVLTFYLEPTSPDLRIPFFPPSFSFLQTQLFELTSAPPDKVENAHSCSHLCDTVTK